jgi:hypothetical protein
MECYVAEKRYDIQENANFGNKELWKDFIQELLECNQIMEATNGLVQDELVLAYNQEDKSISKEDYANKTNHMIKANQECIEFIRSKL